MVMRNSGKDIPHPQPFPASEAGLQKRRFAPLTVYGVGDGGEVKKGINYLNSVLLTRSTSSAPPLALAYSFARLCLQGEPLFFGEIIEHGWIDNVLGMLAL